MTSKDIHSASLKKLREEITFHKDSITLLLEKPIAYNMRELMAGRPLIDPTEDVLMKVRYNVT